MTDITDLGVAEIRDGFRGGAFSAREVADAFNDAVAGSDALNCFIVKTPEKALEAAEEADRALAAGEARPLSGVPLGIKDLFCTKGVQSTAASHILEGFVPPYESTVSGNLLDAGAGMLGKLNMDQFAMGSSNETSYFGNVVSP
ncbi:MAG: amidase family protein, partial [Parasphingopyxis sp.]